MFGCFKAKKVVMVGDYYTLNPVVKSAEADAMGYSVSLFRRLCELHPHKVVILRQSYTMSEALGSMMNSIAYKGLIRH